MNKKVTKNIIFSVFFIFIFSLAISASANTGFRTSNGPLSTSSVVEDTNPFSFIKVEETGVKLFESNKSISSSDSVNEKNQEEANSKNSKKNNLSKDSGTSLGNNKLTALSLVGADDSFMPSSIWGWLLTIILILILIIIMRILIRRNSNHK
jgi:hypothetical protein